MPSKKKRFPTSLITTISLIIAVYWLLARSIVILLDFIALACLQVLPFVASQQVRICFRLCCYIRMGLVSSTAMQERFFHTRMNRRLSWRLLRRRTNTAIRMNTSRRRLKPSPGFTSYKMYLEDKFRCNPVVTTFERAVSPCARVILSLVTGQTSEAW